MASQEIGTEAASSVAAVASKVTSTGGAIAGAGWALSSEFISAVGLLLAIAGFAVNYYFNRKRDQREDEHHKRMLAEHEATMRRLLGDKQ